MVFLTIFFAALAAFLGGFLCCEKLQTEKIRKPRHSKNVRIEANRQFGDFLNYNGAPTVK